MTPRAGRFAALLATLVLATACAEQPKGTDGARALSDTGGPIELALVVVSSPARSGLRNQELVERIAKGLGPNARLLILADPEMVLEPNPWPQRMEFVEIPDDLRFSIWPQDPFVVLADPSGESRLLVPRGYGREQDREMARVAAERLGWEVEQSSLFFAGGNVLSDERTAFVGADLVQENAESAGESAEQVRHRFEAALGLPVVVVGRAPQPAAHLDMLFTPIGHGRVAVADAALGADLAEAELKDRPEAVRAFERFAEEQFFGHPELLTMVDHEGRTLHRPTISGGTERAIARSRLLAPALDSIADDLVRRGYDVVRLPLLMTPVGAAEPMSWREGAREYPTLSYNNVLVEYAPAQGHVYVPEYGFAALDRAALDAWEAEGFHAHAVPGVTTGSIYRGSLRCAVKVLRRGATP